MKGITSYSLMGTTGAPTISHWDTCTQITSYKSAGYTLKAPVYRTLGKEWATRFKGRVDYATLLFSIMTPANKPQS